MVSPLFFTLLLACPDSSCIRRPTPWTAWWATRITATASSVKVAARADDLFNLLPARLTAFLMVPAAAVAGLDYRAPGASSAGMAARHQPQRRLARSRHGRALGVRLGGPNTYFGRLVDKPSSATRISP